ncbi:MAG: hypothetical protein B6229_09060 [Spirochaetaceae bacterium 4572_7]|nr:MAG: hypothetical protein B6229_09060 [Spirochaetaceae bacterium 4572_7]
MVLSIQEHNIESVSTLLTGSINSMINSSVKNSLKHSAENTEELVQYYYSKYTSGDMSKDAAVGFIRDLILYGPYSKIGETGYVAILKSNGLLFIHPKSEGVNVSKASFWKDVEGVLNSDDKEGYIEYEWKNKDEKESRTKSGYIVYFEPWDMVIWASAYKSEFIDLVDKNDFRDDILHAGDPFDSYGYVIDSTGMFVIHPEKEGVSAAQNSFVQEMIQNKKGYVKYMWSNGEGGKPYKKIAYYGYVKSLDWIVVISADYKKLLEPVIPLTISIGAGLFIALFVFLFVSNIIGKIIAKKINRFNTIFTKAGTGDLTLEYRATGSLKMQDEIDEMGAVFNSFIGDYKGILIKLREITDTVVELIQALSSSSQETSSTANQQAAAVKEIVSTMEDVDALTRSIEKKVIEITRISEDTQSTVQNGFGIVKNSMIKMDEINIANKTTIDGIRLLSERIDNIWDIVNMINGIADQTKIIAFNAELEASAAGEAGKNFQIVATEIRRLADSTVHSTNEIKEKITEIQKSSDRLILTSEDGTEKIKEGNLLTENINNLFQDILNSAEVSTDSTKNVSKSIAQQVVTFEQTLIAIKQISGGVDNIAVAARETAGASDNLRGVSESIESILSTYTLEESKEESNSETY